MCLSTYMYWQWKLANKRARASAVTVWCHDSMRHENLLTKKLLKQAQGLLLQILTMIAFNVSYSTWIFQQIAV